MARDRSRVLPARAKEPCAATRVNTRMAYSWSMGGIVKQERTMNSLLSGFSHARSAVLLLPATGSNRHVRLRSFRRPRTRADRTADRRGAVVGPLRDARHPFGTGRARIPCHHRGAIRATARAGQLIR